MDSFTIAMNGLKSFETKRSFRTITKFREEHVRKERIKRKRFCRKGRDAIFLQRNAGK